MKRTGVGGKGRVNHTEEAYNGVHVGFVQDCGGGSVHVCVTHAGKRKGDGVHVCESTFINAEMLQACGHGDKRRNKIKAPNMHPLPLLGLVFTGRSTRQLAHSSSS